MSIVSEEDSSLVIVERPSMSDLSPQPPDLLDEEHVELTEISGPKPFQIVSIGSEQDSFAFSFDKEKLQLILEKVPSEMKVAVVSVVGAFRTGKSFLLSWFLRYLEHITTKQEGDDTTEIPWYKSIDSLGKNGFSWKAGAERNTTGIWVWSEPYVLKNNTAVLLIDTQGMFDHDTSMELTASIFGLSTLLSSLLIYNVDKQVQEDNLQQLALFSEYARIGVGASNSENPKEANVEVSEKGQVSSLATNQPKPFQQIEFLVRDWEHFNEEDEDNLELLEESMKEYIQKVLADRGAKDLQDTREQILNCFDKITCYGLCHPGKPVTRKTYDGRIDVLDETFLGLLGRYCERVFDPENIQAKQIHGQMLTATQLGVFMEVYADLFSSGAKFPTAGTMLEATANANNTNAVHIGTTKYKDGMDRIAGPSCSSYVSPEELKADHARIRQESLQAFETMANFGSKKNIDAAREELQAEIESFFTYYDSLNESRNPLAGFELYVCHSLDTTVVFVLTSDRTPHLICCFCRYVAPAGVAIVSYTARLVTDATCSVNVCRSASEVFSHVYIVVAIFIAIVAGTKFKQIKDAFKRFKKALEVMTNEKNKQD